MQLEHLIAVGVFIVILISLKSGCAGGRSGFCAGTSPQNIGYFDAPYYYPNYEGVAATRWDYEQRCSAYCQNSPCAVWCR